MNDQKGDRESEIRRLFPLVRKIARRICRLVPGSEIDDLVGDGCIGLIRAVDMFDATRGASIDRYAARVIVGAMLNGVRQFDPVSERVRREMREAERERYAIATQTGVLPTHVEVESRRPGYRAARIKAYRHAPLSLDGPLPPGERVSTNPFDDPVNVAVEHDEQNGIRAAIRRLPARQCSVLTLHYLRGRSLHEVGRLLAISPQRASQLHIAGIGNLRKMLHGAH